MAGCEALEGDLATCIDFLMLTQMWPSGKAATLFSVWVQYSVVDP